MNDNYGPGAGPSSGRETRSRGRPETSSPPPLSIPQPHASSSLSSPNVMTRRVLGTPLRKRRRGSGPGVRQGSFDGSPGDLVEYVEAGEDESRLFFEKRKRQRRWLCERERVLRANSLHKILQREVTDQGNLGFAKKASSERFRRMQVQQTFNTYDAKENERWKLSFLKKRSRVVEIVGAKGMIFALAHSGVCVAFSRETGKRLCYLNTQEDEVVRSLFYNKNNDTLITVSVYATDNYSSLKCRSTPLEFIRRGKPEEGGMPLFEEESLQWPGFVEFDDVNGKVLTYNAQKHTYKIFDLKNYNLLYKITDRTVSEIKVSPGILLLIHEYETKDHVPLEILSVETGRVLKSFKHALLPNRQVDFIEQFDEKLLIKQDQENLRIADVCSGEMIEVLNTRNMSGTSFIFLFEVHLFLTMTGGEVKVFDFHGELVTSFEDHRLWSPNSNQVHITNRQDEIVSYCRAPDVGDQSSINVSCILTGKCHAKLQGEECLEDVTSLYFNEERNEIYTGNASGKVFVWAN